MGGTSEEEGAKLLGLLSLQHSKLQPTEGSRLQVGWMQRQKSRGRPEVEEELEDANKEHSEMEQEKEGKEREREQRCREKMMQKENK